MGTFSRYIELMCILANQRTFCIRWHIYYSTFNWYD